MAATVHAQHKPSLFYSVACIIF